MTAAVIFDLYGTLLQIPHDSQPFSQLARRTASYRSAIECALTQNNSTLADYATNIGLQQSADIRELQTALEDDIRHIQPYDDAIPTLTLLKNRKIKIAVISNLATPYKQPFFTHAFDKLVDVTIFSCDCGYIKPNSEIYEIALRQLDCEINKTMMVGDSLRSDVKGPSQLGIRSLHLVRSSRPSPASNVISSLHSVIANCNGEAADS